AGAAPRATRTRPTPLPTWSAWPARSGSRSGSPPGGSGSQRIRNHRDASTRRGIENDDVAAISGPHGPKPGTQRRGGSGPGEPVRDRGDRGGGDELGDVATVTGDPGPDHGPQRVRPRRGR